MLSDVSRELLDMAKTAKIRASSGSDYDVGRHFAFYEVVSLLVQSADAFGIDQAEIGLAGIDPERDVLSG